VQIDPDTTNVKTDLAGFATGGGIGVLQAKADAPVGTVDLIAPVGTVDAGDAGIRASGDVHIVAVVVLNADNIQAGGSITGIPTVIAPNVGALTSASNTAGASAKTSELPANTGDKGDRPSIIIVEFLGFGGGDSDVPGGSEQRKLRNDNSQNQDPNSRVQILGAGELTAVERRDLVDEKRKLLAPQ
jgi:hypothetical protein